MLYLWAEPGSSLAVTNTAALVRQGITLTNVLMQTGFDGTTPISNAVNVAAITINATNDINFALFGLERNTTNNLVLSAWPHYNFRDGAPTRIVDYITVPVAVGEPRATTVGFSGPTSILATSNRFEAATFKIALQPTTKVATNDIAVTVTPSDGWEKYVFFSSSST